MRVKPCHYVPQKSDSLVGSERIHRVIMRESRYNPRAVSGGNYGLMQIRLQLHRNCDQRTYLMHLRPSFGLSRAGDWRDIVSVASSPAFAFDQKFVAVPSGDRRRNCSRATRRGGSSAAVSVHAHMLRHSTGYALAAPTLVTAVQTRSDPELCRGKIVGEIGSTKLDANEADKRRL
jgi:hypothetical protein